MDPLQSRTSKAYVNGSSTSIHLTLPISCQICLGKVKDPVVCSNQHVFCSACLNLWLRNRDFCPVCRTTINVKNPYKKILGSFDESGESIVNDPSIKLQMRRTRLKLFFEELQAETEYLDEAVKSCSSENVRLKEENEHLRIHLEDARELSRIRDHQKKSQDVASNKENSVDINTILKLSSKLQEMISANEKLAEVNSALRKDLTLVRDEKDMYQEEMRRLREESKFSQSPQKYNKYAMVALQTKVDNYEREMQQWKKALKRADEYIEELTTQLDHLKNKETHSTLSSLDDRIEVPSQLSPASSDQYSQAKPTHKLHDAGSSIKNSNYVSRSSLSLSNPTSASHFLKMLLPKSDVSTSVPFGCAGKSPALLEELYNTNSPTEVVENAERFPACAKLLELTKAREGLKMSDSGKHSRQLFSNNDAVKVRWTNTTTPTDLQAPCKSRYLTEQGVRGTDDQHADAELLKRKLEIENITLVLPAEHMGQCGGVCDGEHTMNLNHSNDPPLNGSEESTLYGFSPEKRIKVEDRT